MTQGFSYVKLIVIFLTIVTCSQAQMAVWGLYATAMSGTVYNAAGESGPIIKN